MHDKRYRINLLFNANKVYDRHVVEGVGEYLQASQTDWDIFIEEDFRCRMFRCRLSAAFIISRRITRWYTTSPPIMPRWWSGRLCTSKRKALTALPSAVLPASSGKRWAQEREQAFCQLMMRERYQGVVYQGMETAPENCQHAQNRLAADADTANRHHRRHRLSRHLLQACEHLKIPMPEKLAVIGIGNEELTRYLSRVALSSVAQGTRQMGVLSGQIAALFAG